MPENVKRAFVCPKCGSWGYATKSWDCTICSVRMVPIPYETEIWTNLPSDQQNGIIRHWIKTKEWIDISDLERMNAVVAETAAEKALLEAENSSSFSGWINFLRVIAYFFLIGGMITSFAVGITMIRHSVTGWLVIVLGTLCSFASMAGIMVFLDMAGDIRKIRAMLESEKKR